MLLVADEVICGFGRTGRWFGVGTLWHRARHHDRGQGPVVRLRADRRGAARPAVGDALAAANEEWAHGFTYSGHPVAAAVALENLRIIEAEGLHQRAGGSLGDHFAAALAGLADHPLVGETRSCGLLGALELVEDKRTRRYFPPARKVGLTCREHCIANGLVMRAVRDVMILAPPLVITEDEIDEIARRARRALDLTMRDLELA